MAMGKIIGQKRMKPLSRERSIQKTNYISFYGWAFVTKLMVEVTETKMPQDSGISKSRMEVPTGLVSLRMLTNDSSCCSIFTWFSLSVHVSQVNCLLWGDQLNLIRL